MAHSHWHTRIRGCKEGYKELQIPRYQCAQRPKMADLGGIMNNVTWKYVIAFLSAIISRPGKIKPYAIDRHRVGFYEHVEERNCALGMRAVGRMSFSSLYPKWANKHIIKCCPKKPAPSWPQGKRSLASRSTLYFNLFIFLTYILMFFKPIFEEKAYTLNVRFKGHSLKIPPQVRCWIPCFGSKVKCLYFPLSLMRQASVEKPYTRLNLFERYPQ